MNESQLYRLIVENATDYAIFTLDGRGRVTSWNPGAQTVFGFTKGEMLDQLGEILFTPEDRAAGVPGLEMSTAAERGKALDERFHMKKDGSRFWGSGLMFPLKNDQGTAIGYLKIVRDTTDRRRRVDELKAEVAERDRLLEMSHDAVIVRDEQGRVRYWNRGAVELYGWDAEEAIGRPTQELLGTDRKALETIAASLAERGSWSGRLVHRGRDGRAIIVSSRWVVEKASGRVLEINRDLSALEASVDELKRAEKQLADVAYASAHDLREPLRRISLHAERLARRSGEDGEGSSDLRYVLDSVTRLGGALDALATYARIGREGAPAVPVPLLPVVRETVSDLDAEKLIRVDSKLPTALGRRAELKLLFRHLLGNALKFRADRPPVIQVETECPGPECIIAVRDNGLGFEPKYAETIFEPFKRLTTRAEFPGAGLGLAICQRVAESHGGRVWAEGKPGEGAVFRVMLPASR